MSDQAKRDLHDAIEDIVYAWSLDGAPIDNLMEALYDFVIETYGPPF